MNGVVLGIGLRMVFLDCKVILLSGEPSISDLITDALSAENGFLFLEKPLPPRVLLKYVAESLKRD